MEGSADVLVHRAVCGAGAVVLAFLIHAECVPCGRTEDVLIGDVVHADGDAQHRAERDEIRADVTIGDRAVIRAPVLHDGVSALKRAAGLAVAARGEPGARPRGVRALHERVGDLLGQMHGPALGDLQHGAEALDEVQADHGRGHFRTGDKVAGEAAAAEIKMNH